jgi:TIR domain
MINVFFSYSHKDEELRNELETHLATLKRQGVITTWYDRRIDAGDEFAGKISDNLESADIILLLVSPYFIASDYCYEVEMKRALERHERGEVKIIPVILQPCDWHSTPFGKLMAVPADGKPVSKFPNMHDALLEVTNAIRNAVEKMTRTVVTGGLTTIPPSTSVAVSELRPRSSNLRIKKSFTDRDKDKFLEDAFEYIANFFEGSMSELVRRNLGVEGNFKRIDANRFTGTVYVAGKTTSRCKISHGGRRSFMSGINYSMSDSLDENSFNEQLSVEDDGYTLSLRPLGMMHSKEAMTVEGAAEYYWEIFIKPLQS